MKYTTPTIKKLLMAEDNHTKDFHQLTAVTAEAQGNLEHIYKAIADLKQLCANPVLNDYVDETLTPELIDEVTSLLNNK